VSIHIRMFLYRLCGIKIGKHCFIGMKCYFDDTCYGDIKIGRGVTISYGVYMCCHGKRQKNAPIVIGDSAYIGMRAGIISKNADGTEKGVHIGERATIGAYTLVNRDIPPDATAVGVPCRIIKERVIS
ncbi:MAG: acyltransferase, partial [Clostridia bacterium]|nr:acyltransferase [Clostridia bacterium]